MILGIQRLITLGDIMCNFRKLKMVFSIMGKNRSLMGIQPPAVRMITTGKMDILLAKHVELCMLSVGLLMEESP